MSSQRSASARTHPVPTPRDLKIIRSVCQHGALTRAQLRHLCFHGPDGLSSVQAACRRLKLLTEREYLGRMRIPTALGSGPYVYLLGARAQVALGRDEGSLAKTTRRRQVRSAAELKHGLEVVDFHIRLHEAMDALGGRVVIWLSEREAHYALPGRGRTLPFTPDAYCLWALSGEEGAFFLEWDRGTESMTRIAEKLARYETYYGLRAYRDHLGENGLQPRILFVVSDERRRKQFIVWLARRLAKGEWRSLPTILIATRGSSSAEPLGPVWRRPGHERRLRLVD